MNRNRLQPRRLIFAVLACTCCVAQSVGAQATQPSPESTEESKFLRFVADDAGGGQLQTSVVTYQNKDGVTVDLIAAVHIADAPYFHELDKSFAQYDALLYEMVKPRDMTPADRLQAQREGQRPLGFVNFMQNFMKDVLELSFQLDEIDYTKPNFVHADLDVETFQQMQADRGESLLTLMIQQMIRELSRTPEQGAAAEPDITQLLTALGAADRARQLKLMLARQFGQMDEMISGGGALDGSVILSERNRAALTTLRKRIDAGDRKIGVFYGAAHLKGMEKDLTGLMGFKQVGEPQWKSAWDMTAPALKPPIKPSTRPATPPPLPQPSKMRT